MKNYSSLTKKELIEELRIIKSCYEIANGERMNYLLFLQSLGSCYYYSAQSDIDRLPLSDDLKIGLSKTCEILQAVTKNKR